MARLHGLSHYATPSFIHSFIHSFIQPARRHLTPPEQEAQSESTKGTGLRNVLGKTEADAVVPVGGEAPDPGGDTQVHRFVDPGTATEHAVTTVPDAGLCPPG